MDKTYKIQNTFNDGMNKDNSFYKYPPSQYYDLKNFRIISDQEGATLALSTVDGNIKKITLASNAYTIIGIESVRNTIVIFAYKSDVGTYIYTVTDDGTTTIQTPTEIYTDKDLATADKLGYTSSTKLHTTGRYENENLQKVYFCDGTNSLRMINIVDDNLSSATQSHFNVVPNLNIGTVVFNNYTAGNLDPGVISYSYQLYSPYGSETNFAPTSSLIPVSQYIDATNINRLLGNSTELNTGKGIYCTISGLDNTNYSRIRVIAVQYRDESTTPEIRIISDSDFSATTFNFTDTGLSLGSYTAEELNSFGLDIIPKYIETKDNYLFAGNIKLQSFWTDAIAEWDARAYRFKSDGGTGVSGYVELINDGVTNVYSYADMDEIPATADAVNSYNTLGNESSYPFKYVDYTKWLVGTTGVRVLGGGGLNVAYLFNTYNYLIDNAVSSTGINCSINTDNKDWITGIKRGFQRDEVYRFGVIFYNNKGQRSFVKWIGDIRMPNHTDYEITNTVGEDVYAVGLYPTFYFKNIPEEVKYIQVVYVKRNDEDKTVVTQGIISQTLPDTVETVDVWGASYLPFFTEPELEDNLYTLIAPEYLTDQKCFSTGCKAEILYEANLNYKNDPPGSVEGYTYKFSSYDNTSIGNPPINDIIDQKYVPCAIDKEPATAVSNRTVILGNNTGFNYAQYYSTPGRNISTHGRVLAFTSTYFYASGSPASYNTGALMNVRKNITGYGGNTYDARTTNMYIAASSTVAAATVSTVPCYCGDTYIIWMDYLNSIKYDPTDTHLHSIVLFPCESTYNTFLGSSLSYYRDIQKGLELLRMTERAGTTDKYDDAYLQLTDLYLYNKVYSRSNDVLVYYPEPLNFNNIETYDTRVYHSEHKINGEISDSWLKFKAANFIEVDSLYGSINQLLTHNNILLYFQNNGFGVLSVQPRSIIKDNNASQLAIGTGGILDRYDMLSTNYGITSSNHIDNSDNTIYFYDQTRNKFIKFTNDEEEISVVLGLSSWFDSTVQLDNYALVQYNPKYKEIYFTVQSKSTTLVYSELLQKFLGFFSFNPVLYFEHNGNLYSASNTYQLYKHEIGEVNTYHDSPYDSEITLIVNPAQNNVCIFDNIEITSNQFSTSKALITDSTESSITSIQFKTTEQDSGVITCVADDNIVRKFRTWRMLVERDSEDEARMRDAYLKMIIKYTPSNKKLILHDVVTYFRNNMYKAGS